MAAPLSLTASYESVENGWTQARVKELPAVITAAPTREEAKAMLEDAVREYFLALLEEGRSGPASAREEAVQVTISS